MLISMIISTCAHIGTRHDITREDLAGKDGNWIYVLKGLASEGCLSGLDEASWYGQSPY